MDAPYGLLLIAFQGIYLLFSPGTSWRTVIGCGIFQVLLAASLAAYVLKHQVPELMSAMSWLPVPSRVQAIEAIAWNATFSTTVRSWVPKFTYILVGLASFGLYHLWRKGVPQDRSSLPAFLLCSWWILPPACFLAYSYIVHPVFFPRYVLHCSPAFFVLFSVGMVNLRPRLLRNGALALLTAALLFSSTDREKPFRTRWDLLAAEVASLGEPTVGSSGRRSTTLKFHSTSRICPFGSDPSMKLIKLRLWLNETY
ncbi:MAG: hypothetical protein HC888_04430 [Candidatus Competibacteraceae bacterium]|nr:hypothetical protein [Candidatus Competibacteraceae bacterium]